MKVLRKRIRGGLLNEAVRHKKIKQPYSPPELFTLHSLMAFIGHRGSGKTHALVNLAKKYSDEGSLTRIFVISPTYISNPVFHVLDIHNEDVYDNPHNGIAAVEDIIRKCKDDADEYEDYIEYMRAYRKYTQSKELSMDEHTMLKNNNFRRPDKSIPCPSPVLIIDDCSHSDIYSASRQNPFINLCLRHRHLNHGKGITIFMAVQNFRSGLPLALRQNICVFFLWPTHDSGQLDAIYSEVANLIDEEMFLTYYHEATDKPHGFLTIETSAAPGKQFRADFDTFLECDKNKLS